MRNGEAVTLARVLDQYINELSFRGLKCAYAPVTSVQNLQVLSDRLVHDNPLMQVLKLG